jgi:mRNA-degrading endonuclease RelE of RelBE toxin-antitoxin system
MAKLHKKRRKAQAPAQKPATAVLAPYEIEMVPSAEAVYRKLFQNMQDAETRGEKSSSHHTTFRMVQEVIKAIIPRNPIDRSYGLSGPLSKYFRIKKGRMRICWAANSAARKVTILFISETMRKEGDASDPYNIFTKRVMSGEFQKFLESK